MKEKQRLSIAGVIIIILCIAGFYYYQQQDQQREDTHTAPTSEEQEGGEEIVLEGDVPEAMQEVADAIEDQVERMENAPDTGAELIDIPLTPYTVYVGSANKYGSTSPETFMQTPVSQAVVGYEWQALVVGPSVSTLAVPDFGNVDAEYDISSWKEDSYISLGKFNVADEVVFPREGFTAAYRFKITGIDPELRICPGDRATDWKVRFTFQGNYGLVRTPITQELPSGELCTIR